MVGSDTKYVDINNKKMKIDMEADKQRSRFPYPRGGSAVSFGGAFAFIRGN